MLGAGIWDLFKGVNMARMGADCGGRREMPEHVTGRGRGAPNAEAEGSPTPQRSLHHVLTRTRRIHDWERAGSGIRK